jgi:hypothetical protein
MKSLDHEEVKMTYQEWFAKNGFELESTIPVAGDHLTWSRPTKYGAPKCTVNKAPVRVYVSRVDDGKFVMAVRAATENYWGNLEVYDISEDYLTKRGQAIEHRLVAAWMELSA